MRGVMLAIIAITLAVGCTSPANPGVAFSTGPDDAQFAPGLEGPPSPDSGADDDTVTFMPMSLDLVGPPGVMQTMPVGLIGTGGATNLVSFEWHGDASSTFSVMPPSPACVSVSDGIGCLVMPPAMIKPGPFAAMVSCMPSATPRSATLKALTNSPSGASGSMVVTCKTPTSNPSFSIPNSVPVTANVNGMTMDFLRVTNDGDQALMIQATLDALDPDTAQWQAGPLCVTAPCPLPLGMHVDIPVSLHPTRDGAGIDTQLGVQSVSPAIAAKSATLEGTGQGGVLRVDQPAPPDFQHDFGTIAKNQVASFTVEMTNTGNVDINVMPSTPAAPFAIVATPAPPILITKNNGMSTFDITCSSMSPMTQQSATVMLGVSANTYDQNTDHVGVKCAIANTTVQVTNPLDFPELRVGGDEGTLDVEITNPPGGGNVTITRVQLVGAPTALTIDTIATPATLADGQQLTTQLHLSTAAEVLSLAGAKLEIDVNEGTVVTLSLPITGKVTVPAAVVLPSRLDLGSVCVGTPVAGEVTMTNTGSATLTMQRPTMTSTSFVALYTKPLDYPAALLPMDKATVGVMAATDAKGMLDGTLEWPVDVDVTGKFTVPVSLHILDEGTAVSPATLPFGTADITDLQPMPQTIRIENCGPGNADVGYDHVVASRGTASAWVLDPPNQQRTLLPGEEMRVRVAFAPKVPGAHIAQLPIAIDGGETQVRLEGDATGTLPDKTSFYACSDCNGSGAPGGWPIAGVFVLMLRRRRQRTC